MIFSNCFVLIGFLIFLLSKFCVVFIIIVWGRYVCFCLIYFFFNVNNNVVFNFLGECGLILIFWVSWLVLLKLIFLMLYINW